MYPSLDVFEACRLGIEISNDEVILEHYKSDERTGLRRARVRERWRQLECLDRVHGRAIIVRERVGLPPQEPRRKVFKELRKDTQSGVSKLQSYKEAARAMGLFSHPCCRDLFVCLYGWAETDLDFIMVMEYLEHGSLTKCLVESNGLAESETCCITSQVLEGLEFIHGANFVHQDIKPENLFVVAPGPNWWIKLGGFGVPSRQTSTTIWWFTPGYQAPECIRLLGPPPATPAVDMWSLGCVAYNLLTRDLPFPDQLDLHTFLKDDKFCTDLLRANFEVSKECCHFIEALLKAEGSDRLTCNQATKSAWIRRHREKTIETNHHQIAPTTSSQHETAAYQRDNVDDAEATEGVSTAEELKKRLSSLSHKHAPGNTTTVPKPELPDVETFPRGTAKPENLKTQVPLTARPQATTIPPREVPRTATWQPEDHNVITPSLPTESAEHLCPCRSCGGGETENGFSTGDQEDDRVERIVCNPPRTRSLGQRGIPDRTRVQPRAAARPAPKIPAKPLRFSRSADVYNRMEKDEKGESHSQDSSRISMADDVGSTIYTPVQYVSDVFVPPRTVASSSGHSSTLNHCTKPQLREAVKDNAPSWEPKLALVRCRYPQCKETAFRRNWQLEEHLMIVHKGVQYRPESKPKSPHEALPAVGSGRIPSSWDSEHPRTPGYPSDDSDKSRLPKAPNTTVSAPPLPLRRSPTNAQVDPCVNRQPQVHDAHTDDSDIEQGTYADMLQELDEVPQHPIDTLDTSGFQQTISRPGAQSTSFSAPQIRPESTEGQSLLAYTPEPQSYVNGGPGSAVNRLPPNACFEDLVAAMMLDVTRDMQRQVRTKLDEIDKLDKRAGFG